MSTDPHLGTGDWLGIGGLAASVVGAIVGGVRTMLGARDARLTTLEHGHHDQTTELAVLKTCQENTRDQLAQIRETTRDTNEKIDLLVKAALHRS